MPQIIDRTGQRGEVQHIIHGAVDLQRMRDVVADELEAVVFPQRLDVLQSAGDEVIHADDFIAALEETFAQMGTDEAGAAGDDRSHVESPLLRATITLWQARETALKIQTSALC